MPCLDRRQRCCLPRSSFPCSFLSWFQPSLDDRPEGCRVKMVQLVPPLPHSCHQARRFQYFQMLRNRLPRQTELMLHGQAIAQLEESLAISIHELVKNRAARRSSDCLKDIAHGTLYTQAVTCLSRTIDFRIAEPIHTNPSMPGYTGRAQPTSAGLILKFHILSQSGVANKRNLRCGPLLSKMTSPAGFCCRHSSRNLANATLR